MTAEATLSPTARFNRISESGLCIGCGICQSMAESHITESGRAASKGKYPGRIQMRIQAVNGENNQGYERPVVSSELDTELVDRIYQVCPGTRVEGLPESELDADSQYDSVWGQYQRIVLAYASDPAVRFRGATGGVLTALAIYLLEAGKVDFILHAKASTEQPMFGEPHLSFTTEDVIEGAGSRYGPTPSLRDIHSVLDREQSFAFVGLPCDIGALRNLARLDSRVNQQVKYWMTPVCGGFSPPAATLRFYDSIGVDESEVKSLSYRGHGCPGPTRVETHDGRTIDRNYIDFWGEDASQWSLPFRCKICPDGIGEAADIAASDTWPGGGPEREGQKDDPGTNAAIARTKTGRELLIEAQQAGYLTLTKDIGIAEMNLYQPHQVNKKYAAWARHQGLSAMGSLSMETRRLRIEALAGDMDPEFIRTQSEGTRQRVRDGKTTEPTPR